MRGKIKVLLSRGKSGDIYGQARQALIVNLKAGPRSPPKSPEVPRSPCSRRGLPWRKVRDLRYCGLNCLWLRFRTV
jgi:hypothetical protein